MAGELPLERLADPSVVVLEAEEPVLEFLKGLDVVRCESLPLYDEEGDLDLIEPTRRESAYGRL